MSDPSNPSQQKKSVGHGTKTPAELQAMYPDTSELESLKVWQYHAIARHEVYGDTWDEVGEIFGRSGNYVCKIGNSPAGKRFREKIKNLEPEQIAEVTLKAASVNATQDFMMALEWAKEARDYEAVRRMTKDLLDFADVGSKGSRGDGGGQSIIINLDAASLDSPTIETSYEELEAEVVDED